MIKSIVSKDDLSLSTSCSFSCHKNCRTSSVSRLFICFVILLVLLAGMCYVYLYGMPRPRGFSDADVVCCPTQFRSSRFRFTNHTSIAGGLDDNENSPVQAKGRFVYLVTGEREPNPRWRRLSEQEGVYVIFVAWKFALPRPHIADKVQLYYLPDSTWTSCRNFLLEKAKLLEKEHGEQFDYLLFADEDVLLSSRSPKRPGWWSKDPLSSALILHRHLLRDKPARASVEYTGRNINEFGLWCVRSCANDGALDIYHRTIVPYLLPYFETFDDVSWQMSQYMINLRSQALMEDYCYIYRDVFVNPLGNVHGSYPTNYDLLDNATVLISNCLARRGLHLTIRPEESEQQARTRAIYRPVPEAHTVNCSRQRMDVDYSKVLKEILKSWPLTCPLDALV